MKKLAIIITLLIFCGTAEATVDARSAQPVKEHKSIVVAYHHTTVEGHKVRVKVVKSKRRMKRKAAKRRIRRRVINCH